MARPAHSACRLPSIVRTCAGCASQSRSGIAAFGCAQTEAPIVRPSSFHHRGAALATLRGSGRGPSRIWRVASKICSSSLIPFYISRMRPTRRPAPWQTRKFCKGIRQRLLASPRAPVLRVGSGRRHHAAVPDDPRIAQRESRREATLSPPPWASTATHCRRVQTANRRPSPAPVDLRWDLGVGH